MRKDKEVVGNISDSRYPLNTVVSDASSPIVSMDSVREVAPKEIGSTYRSIPVY
jgi:hypothetical protein